MDWIAIKGALSWWALIGYFAVAGTANNKIESKKQAAFQWIILGPVVWVGVPLFCAWITFKRRIHTPELAEEGGGDEKT